MLNKIQYGRTDLVFDYLGAGHDANSCDQQGTALISWCAYYGDVSAIKFLLSRGARLEDLGPNYNLNGAAFHGHWQLCQFLLEKGGDPNKRLPGTGETPLHACLCAANNPASNFVVKLLLAKGADPNLPTLANKETGSFMRDARTRKETPLHRAAAFGNEETIQLLLDAGADKASKDMALEQYFELRSFPQHIIVDKSGKIIASKGPQLSTPEGNINPNLLSVLDEVLEK